MAHQAHALPWSILANNIEYKKYFEPRTQRIDYEINARSKGFQAKECAHFGRVLAHQIHEFSNSERVKYESQAYYVKRATNWTESLSAALENEGLDQRSRKQKQEDASPVESRLVYSDRIKDRYWANRTEDRALEFNLSLFSTESQKVQNWLEGTHGSCNIDFGDTIKIVMMEASAAEPALSGTIQDAPESSRYNMETLLLMANHPRISLGSFVNMHWGHHFGVSRVAEEAVKSYVYLNVLFVMKEAGSKAFNPFVDENGNEDKHQRQNYMVCGSYSRLLSSVAGSYDGDAQCIVHKDFFYSKPWTAETRAKFATWNGRYEPTVDVLEDVNKLREYLRGVWRIMVTYDMVLREAGRDPEWEYIFSGALGNLYGIYSDG